ncbi:hypothetical protein EYZ11_012771 [Aspergillus tanneri]|uniref:Uncharacterized protein n=1 Tax=Aspergillus tanneri TaxID=1220188 RepID=A0A4S3IZD6_9EURO|nr:hypothetical protein EYZ11_012771 [Aspergillus tanneri]
MLGHMGVKIARQVFTGRIRVLAHLVRRLADTVWDYMATGSMDLLRRPNIAGFKILADLTVQVNVKSYLNINMGFEPL